MARTSYRSKTPGQKPELEVVAPEPIITPPPASNSADSEDAPPPVGEQLRKERERRGISIEAVAQMLKIRRVYLKAIEESNWNELPEPVYVSGFIRSYANFLGLNVQHPIPSAKTEIINLPSLPKLEIPKPIDDQQLPSISTIIIVVVGLFFLYALWAAIHSDADNTATQNPPATIEQSAVTSDTSAATPTPTLLDEPALVHSADEAATAAPTQPTPTANTTPAPTTAPAPAKPAIPAATAFGAPNPTRATITATQDSWIEIQTPKKEVVFTGVLRTGDSYRVPDNATLLLSTTNLSGLKFDLDGAAALPPIDTQNTVNAPLSLSPDHFLRADVPPLIPATFKPVTTPAPKPKATQKATTKVQTPQPSDGVEDSTSDYPDD